MLSADGRRTVAAVDGRRAGDAAARRTRAAPPVDRAGGSRGEGPGGLARHERGRAVARPGPGVDRREDLVAAPPRRCATDPAGWCPPDTVSRALAPIAGVRTDVRRASRLIVIGDLRVPRVTVQQEPGGPPTRIAIDIAPRAATHGGAGAEAPARALRRRRPGRGVDQRRRRARRVGDGLRPGDPRHRPRQGVRHVPRGHGADRRGVVAAGDRAHGRRRARLPAIRTGQSGPAPAAAAPAPPPPAVPAASGGPWPGPHRASRRASGRS
ncbi:MAG: hypothetical protein MZV63_18175 [Marinilabiliales bacterium]|nr:hypothetical protein [Marinilabiliales bacterium]